MEEYVAFWSGQPEVNRIWVSLYTPQLGEQRPEMLGPQDRKAIARELPALAKRYPKLLMNEDRSHDPSSPEQSRRLPVLKDVCQLFGRFEKSRREADTLCTPTKMTTRTRHRHQHLQWNFPPAHTDSALRALRREQPSPDAIF